MAWEYTVETLPLDHTGPTPNEILNALGADGWELVSVISQPSSGAVYVILFLKREIVAARSNQGGGDPHHFRNAKSNQLPRLMKRRKD